MADVMAVIDLLMAKDVNTLTAGGYRRKHYRVRVLGALDPNKVYTFGEVAEAVGTDGTKKDNTALGVALLRMSQRGLISRIPDVDNPGHYLYHLPEG